MSPTARRSSWVKLVKETFAPVPTERPKEMIFAGFAKESRRLARGVAAQPELPKRARKLSEELAEVLEAFARKHPPDPVSLLEPAARSSAALRQNREDRPVAQSIERIPGAAMPRTAKASKQRVGKPSPSRLDELILESAIPTAQKVCAPQVTSTLLPKVVDGLGP